MIVPIAAGGPTDTNGRIVAEQLTKFWGQQVVSCSATMHPLV